jgi:hypothetical protein
VKRPPANFSESRWCPQVKFLESSVKKEFPQACITHIKELLKAA